MTVVLQPFKATDEMEAKVKNAFVDHLEDLGIERDEFFNGAYQCFALGDVLFVTKRSPLADVLTQATFRSSFFAIFQLFTRPGTFEYYLDVFRAIWGEDVEVEFTVPAPGKLLINIEALTLQLNRWVARKIVDDAYVYEPVKETLTGNQIVFQQTQGLKTQSETDALMQEIKPAGIWNVTTLVIA